MLSAIRRKMRARPVKCTRAAISTMATVALALKRVAYYVADAGNGILLVELRLRNNRRNDPAHFKLSSRFAVRLTGTD